MSGCCGPEDDGRYSEAFGQRYAISIARRYRRRGLTRPEQRIVELLSGIGVEGATVLEVGGGVGQLQLELLARGAASTVNLELSDAYEEQAESLIRRSRDDGRVTRIVGIDLAEAGQYVESADVVILHRVVCCYPDFERLLGAAADHARRALVFSHPPSTWLTRSTVGLGNTWMSVLGRRYRGFVHSPDAMIDVLRRHGMVVQRRDRAARWRIAAVVREAAPVPRGAAGATG
jgi:16S rRNA G966 N2-methylase RsmD